MTRRAEREADKLIEQAQAETDRLREATTEELAGIRQGSSWLSWGRCARRASRTRPRWCSAPGPRPSSCSPPPGWRPTRSAPRRASRPTVWSRRRRSRPSRCGRPPSATLGAQRQKFAERRRRGHWPSCARRSRRLPAAIGVRAGRGDRAAARGQPSIWPSETEHAARLRRESTGRGGAGQDRGHGRGGADRRPGPAAGGHDRRAGPAGVRLAAAPDAARAGRCSLAASRRC